MQYKMENMSTFFITISAPTITILLLNFESIGESFAAAHKS